MWPLQLVWSCFDNRSGASELVDTLFLVGQKMSDLMHLMVIVQTWATIKKWSCYSELK